MSQAPAGSESPKVTHHFGRGGAGNVTAKDAKSPVLPPAATPTLKGDHYTTGRGGTGNMAKNDPDRPEEARAAQDIDVPGVMLSEGPQRIGRGGAANVHNPSEQEAAEAYENNERVRSENARKGTGLKALAEKGKDLLTGKSKIEDKA